mmetsp:Transcript_165236/g.525085  ORF Transcript_165236/g.525085 Transcript_165236/m.525085 type:complete len:321 (+) Transcript_165236:33-995(+)
MSNAQAFHSPCGLPKANEFPLRLLLLLLLVSAAFDNQLRRKVLVHHVMQDRDAMRCEQRSSPGRHRRGPKLLHEVADLLCGQPLMVPDEEDEPPRPRGPDPGELIAQARGRILVQHEETSHTTWWSANRASRREAQLDQEVAHGGHFGGAPTCRSALGLFARVGAVYHDPERVCDPPLRRDEGTAEGPDARARDRHDLGGGCRRRQRALQALHQDLSHFVCPRRLHKSSNKRRVPTDLARAHQRRYGAPAKHIEAVEGAMPWQHFFGGGYRSEGHQKDSLHADRRRTLSALGNPNITWSPRHRPKSPEECPGPAHPSNVS